MTSIADSHPRSEGKSLWKSVISALSASHPLVVAEVLTAHTYCLELTPTTLRVSAAGSQLRRWIDERWLADLDSALESVTEGRYDLALVPVVDGADLSADPARTLDTFVVSPANQAARDLADELIDGRAPGPAILLHGGAGSGKTHLLRALARALARPGAAPVVLRNSEELSLELIDAIWKKDLQAFRQRLLGASTLLVDDLQILVGRESTQEQLARTVEALERSGIPVVLAANRPATRLTQLVPPLRDHLAGMRSVELVAPDWETRVAIILERVRRWQTHATPEVASFLAGRLRNSLEGIDTILTRLMTHPTCARGLSDVDVVRHLLNDASRRSIKVAPEDVISLVARHFNLRLRDLRSASRSPRVTTPRQIAMYLVRRHCGLSYPEIGRRFGRHHTTALHSDRLVQRQIDQNGSVRAAVGLLEKELLRIPEERV